MPEWAEKTMRALGDATAAGRGQLTTAEEQLLDAAWLLLRDRLGLSLCTDVPGAVQLAVKLAFDDLGIDPRKAVGR
ncbi:hypothetical protein [Actinomadura sp. DC4]|uniref:hypothetical protein n=1 Tax=Actinomadura sp. DC4 TaxID=3055069 RepID=UPI0025B1F58D|nr:hypothetical protein [Actinomadura sp. DC4]MDN3356032.1 hypothetical protein [Actinomadura sp. DC4]